MHNYISSAQNREPCENERSKSTSDNKPTKTTDTLELHHALYNQPAVRSAELPTSSILT